MIRLRQVTVRNFRNFQGEYKFDFSKNFTIFLGDNGNGKSSIFDAIQWCLTGRIDRFTGINSRENLKNILINKNSNDCFVEILFSNGAAIGRKAVHDGNITVSFKNENNIVKSNEKVNSCINKMLKNSENSNFEIQEFIKTSLLAQDQVLDFIASDSAKDRYQILSSMLGMEKITNLKKNYEQIGKRIVNKIDHKRQLVDSYKKSVSAQKAKIKNEYGDLNTDLIDGFNIEKKQLEKDELVKNKARIEVRLSEYNTLIKDVGELCDDLNLISSFIESLEGDLKNLKERRKNVFEEYTLNKEAVEKNRENINKSKDDEKILSRNKSERKKLEVIKNKLTDFYLFKNTEDLQWEIQEIINRLDEYQYALSNIDRYSELLQKSKDIPASISNLNSEIQQLNLEMPKLLNDISTLHSEYISIDSKNNFNELIKLIRETYIFTENNQEFKNICPICNQSLEHASAHFNNRINTLLYESSVTSGKLDRYKNEIRKSEESISKVQEKLSTKQSRLSKLQIDEREIKAEISDIENDVRYVKNNFEIGRQQLGNLIDKEKKNIEKRNQYLALKREMATIERTLEKNSSIKFSGLDLNVLLKERDDLSERKDELLNQKKKLELEIEEKNQSLDILKKVDKLLNEYSVDYGIKDFNDISKYLADLVDKNSKRINLLTNELNNYRTIIEYNTLSKNLEEDESLLTKEQKNIENLNSKLQIVENEVQRINDSYSFTQIVNNSESIIQQYFNYLNPNVSSYRRLYFNINDEASTLDIEIKNKDKSVRAVNILSSGQLNVLAIAIFIAKNLSNNNSAIDFIAIDDPIQNMDDINQFSMVDVLSRLKKQVIFTTHDAKYVNLFLKKNERRLKDISVYYLDAENDKYENILENE